MSGDKLGIKKKINELECNQWFLHDAYESVNVYSNIDNYEMGLMKGKLSKKVP